MRRAGDLWPRVCGFEPICRAAQRAARGQRRSAQAAAFLDRLEPEALRLERELGADRWRPGPACTFAIHDPKPRTITAMPFRDRVVHHALIAPLEPVFERRMVGQSFACRRGKGTHAAVRYGQRLVRRFGWTLKLDVRACFASLEHPVVRAILARVVKDRRVLLLVDRILAGGPPVGLPIGSLTSQWFANLVLDRLDHFVLEDLRVPGYVRYMDDFALCADDPAVLRAAHDAVGSFLREELHLELKSRATRLAPVRDGLGFLGWRIFPGTVRVRRENLRRYRWRLRHRRWQLARGAIDAAAFRRSVAAVCAHLAHGDTMALRRRWFEGQELEL